MLEGEQPDLVVFSGDQISGFMYKLLNGEPGWVEAYWRRLIQPVNEAGVPYAMTIGGITIQADHACGESSWHCKLQLCQQSWERVCAWLGPHHSPTLPAYSPGPACAQATTTPRRTLQGERSWP